MDAQGRTGAGESLHKYPLRSPLRDAGGQGSWLGHPHCRQVTGLFSWMQAADSGPPFPFSNAGAPKRKYRAWGSRKGAGQQIQQCTPKPYGGGRSAGALSRQRCRP